MAVVLAAPDQLGERELVEHARLPVRELLLFERGLEQVGREHEPAEPEPRRQRLRGGAGVDHAAGLESLERADRSAVVAELAVVVVLDHDAVRRPHPVEQARAPGRDERHPEWMLPVGRQRDRRRRACAVNQRVDLGAVGVDRHRLDREPGRGDDPPVERHARVLHRDRRRAARGERSRDEAQALREPGRDDDLRRRDAEAARPREVRGQLLAQLDASARVAEAERAAGRRRERPPQGAQPRGARERRRVGPARPEIVAPSLGRRLRRVLRRIDEADRRDDGARTAPAADPALRGEVRVRLEDGSAGDPEVVGERPRRRQTGPRGQPAARDRVAQAALEARPHTGTAVDADEEIHTRSGPVGEVGNGPGDRAILPGTVRS